MTSRQIGLIGALGGISLALLKLVESGFFLDKISSTTASASYLTYFVYIFFGVVVSIFFTDRSLSIPKIKKSAFIMGLLAPSVLLAITTQPLGKGESINDSLKGLPQLGALIVRTAHAQSGSSACPAGTIKTPQGVCIKGERITRAQVEPSFREALKSAIGRGAPAKKYTFVVGTTKNAITAEKIAKQLNDLFLNNLPEGSATAKVIIPEGHDNLFVTVGDFRSASKALKTVGKIKNKAIKILMRSTNSAAKISAEQLLKGILVEQKALLASRT